MIQDFQGQSGMLHGVGQAKVTPAIAHESALIAVSMVVLHQQVTRPRNGLIQCAITLSDATNTVH